MNTDFNSKLKAQSSKPKLKAQSSNVGLRSSVFKTEERELTTGNWKSVLRCGFALCVLSFALIGCYLRREVVARGEKEPKAISFTLPIANFTLDYDGKILLLLEDGESLVRVDTNFNPVETIALPRKVFSPRKVLANFASIIISNPEMIFVYDRKERTFRREFFLGGLLDWTILPSGEIIFAKRDDRKLFKIDLFFNLGDFTSPQVDFLPKSLVSLGDNLYLINQRSKALEVYNRLGLRIQELGLEEKGRNLGRIEFCPYQEGEGIYLFSQSGEVFSISPAVLADPRSEPRAELSLTLLRRIDNLKSCFPKDASLFILTRENEVYKVPIR